MSATRSIVNFQWIAFALIIGSVSSCASAPRVGVSSGVTTSQFVASELIARVKTALLNDEVVGKRRIDVHVIDADVTLTGRVASAEERDRAVEIARGVEGVRAVRSELTIQP